MRNTHNEQVSLQIKVKTRDCSVTVT